MPLFGPKPNKIFVFIHFKTDPPTSSQQAQIMASLPKTSLPYVFAEAVQLPKEEYEQALQLPEFYEKWKVAYSEMVAARYVYNHAIGTYSKKVEYKTREMAGFLVTTASGKFG